MFWIHECVLVLTVYWFLCLFLLEQPLRLEIKVLLFLLFGFLLVGCVWYNSICFFFFFLDQKKFAQRSERVKCVDLHPTEPWYFSSFSSVSLFLYVCSYFFPCSDWKTIFNHLVSLVFVESYTIFVAFIGFFTFVSWMEGTWYHIILQDSSKFILWNLVYLELPDTGRWIIWFPFSMHFVFQWTNLW